MSIGFHKISSSERIITMTDYILMTDSGSDIDEKQVKEWDTPVIPINYYINGNVYENKPDHSEFPVPEFYSTIKNGAKVSTSAINTVSFIDYFTVFLKQGKDILYITFSSGLSATYQNALSAAFELKEFYPDRKIEIVDSKCASFGQGLLVYLCAMKKKTGASIEEVRDYAEQMKMRICHEFTVDDLGQLKRGGRISSAAALFGSMLQIKPMLFVDDNGKLAAYDKVRGRKIAVKKIAEMIAGEISDHSNPIFISHGDCIDDVNEFISIIKEKLPERECVVNYIGPVIGAHSGYKTLAVFCVGENRGAARMKN